MDSYFLPQRKSPRSAALDYAADQIYFITWNTKNRVTVFGHVFNGYMILSEMGNMLQNQIFWLVSQYPYLILHACQIMPDHVHILLEINREKGWKVWAQGWKMANYLKGRSAAVGGHAVGGGRDCPLPHDLKLNTRKFKINLYRN